MSPTSNAARQRGGVGTDTPARHTPPLCIAHNPTRIFAPFKRITHHQLKITLTPNFGPVTRA